MPAACLARKAYALSAAYDAAIVDWFDRTSAEAEAGTAPCQSRST